MAQYIQFFPRQTMVGNGEGSGVIYSQIVDVSAAKSMESELRVYAASEESSASGVACSVVLEQNDDPAFEKAWTPYATISQTGTGIMPDTESTIPKRFVRAKLSLEAGKIAVVSFVSRALC